MYMNAIRTKTRYHVWWLGKRYKKHLGVSAPHPCVGGQRHRDSPSRMIQ